MRLEIANNNSTKYIRVVESVWVEKDGKKVTRKRTIKNIGPLSRFDDGKPSYEERFPNTSLQREGIFSDE